MVQSLNLKQNVDRLYLHLGQQTIKIYFIFTGEILIFTIERTITIAMMIEIKDWSQSHGLFHYVLRIGLCESLIKTNKNQN